MLKRLRAIAAFLACHEIWPVALCVVAGIASTRALPLALTVAGLFWLIRWLAYGHLTIRTPADLAIGLLVLMLPVTLWATALPDITRPSVYRLLAGIALYYAVINWTTSLLRLRWLISGTLISGTCLALLALFTVKWIANKFTFIPASLYDRFPLLLSDTIHPNIIAGLLAILLPPALGLLLFSWQQLDWRERILAGIGALVMTSILVLTQSRGGLIALATTLLALTLLRWWRSLPLNNIKNWLLLSTLGIIAVITVRWVVVTRLLEVVTFDNIFTRGIKGRFEIWSRALYMIQDFPFTGVGIGLFPKIVDVLYPFFLVNSTDASHAHNLFLQVAVDLGIPGLIAWLAILILIVIGAWQVYWHGRITSNYRVIGLGAGLLCSQLALISHGLTDAVTWATSRPSPIVWGIWGLTIAAWRVLVVKSRE